ncbi:MAG: hypothetical protein AB7E60_05955 [Sphingobium sp.]
MTARLRLNIQVGEPWDFERITGRADLSGWTLDHDDAAQEECDVHLDEGFDYHARQIGRLLVGPRYVGEHLARMFDAVTGFPVRMAYRLDGDWHYAFTGMISRRHDGDHRGNGGREGPDSETSN